MSDRATSAIRLSSRTGPRDTGGERYVFRTALRVMLRLGARPVPSRSSGTWATPAAIALRGSPARSFRPATCTEPALGARMPAIVSASSRWPLPATPAMPTISPARTRSDTSRSASPPRSPAALTPSSSSATAPGVCSGTLSATASTSRPTINAASERSRGVGRIDRRHRPAAAQHRHAVRDRHHLVELVRDEDHGLALGGHRAQGREQRVRLLRREHRRRLVHDEDPRVAVERLQDLDPLLLADRELPDARARVDGEAVRLAELRDAPLDRRRVDEEPATLAAVVAEHDVLGDGERLDEPEVLVHHADAGVEGIPRRMEVHLLAVELDLALVRAVEPGEDVRERRLPRAVLAEQGVHLADPCLEVDVLVRDDAREPLRDPAHPHGKRRRGAGRAGASLAHWTNGDCLPQRPSPAAGRSRSCRPRP